MDKSVIIENILAQGRQLDYDTRAYLMDRLSRLSKKKTQKTKQDSIRLTDLNCLGTEIWNKVNIDQYVQRERQWN